MRDSTIQAAAVVVAALAVAASVLRGAKAISDNQYEAVAIGDVVAVLDRQNGQVQTFAMSDKTHTFEYVGVHSRGIHLYKRDKQEQEQEQE